MFRWNSCPLNLLLVHSHQAEIITVMRLIQERSNVTGRGLNPDHAIRVVIKSTPLPRPLLNNSREVQKIQEILFE